MLRALRLVGLAVGLFMLPALALSPDRELTQYVHRIWQTQQGLPDGAITRIIQDKEGYLWLATEAGLHRFDGNRFTPADRLIPSAPPNLFIRAATLDATGTFWLAGNDNIIYSVHPSGTHQFGPQQGVPNGLIQCVLRDRDGIVWACTEHGLVRIDPESQDRQVQVIHPADGLHTDNVRTVCQAPDGRLWIGGDSPNITIRSGASYSILPLTSLPEATSVRSLLCDGNTVWAGTSFGLIRIQDGRQQLFTTNDGLVDDFVFSVEKGSGGALWLGTRSGFSRYQNGTWGRFRPHDGLSQSTAQAILEDREGSLWIGTKRGLNQFADGRSVPYTEAEGLPSNETGPITQDSFGVIWAGTLDAGLARFDGRRFSKLTTADGLPSDIVRALVEDSSHTLWAGTGNGLARIVQGRVSERLGLAQGLPSADIRTLFLAHDGTLWIGTAAGLASYSNGHLTTDSRAPRIAIRCIGQDRDGNLLIGIDDGILISSGGKFTPITMGALYMRNPNTFLLDRDGLLWVAHNGAGLRLIEKGRVTAWNTGDGLYDAELRGLAMDDKNRLWMACSRGVFWVDRAELVRFSKGEISRVHSVTYSPTEALRVIEGRQGVQPALWRMQNGQMWLSTVRGLLALDPDPKNAAPPPVNIENPVVNGEVLPPSQIEHLPGGQKNIQFTFAGLSYLEPEVILYRYRLDGQDNAWIDAGNRREASYTNLPPGDYRFHVIACNPGATCAGDGASISFTLAPLFYQRSWFWPVCLLLLGALTWGAYQLHISQLHARYDLILSERSRIARELHDTLIQGFSGITMALQALSARIHSPGERETLHDIIHDAATCLRETRQSVAGLRAIRDEREPESNLAAAIRQAVRELTETKPIRVKLNLDDIAAELLPDVEYNLLRIVREAVNNSVKHSGAGEIEVKLRAASEALNISIRDDGSGFHRDGAAAPGPGHYGIIGMKERATQIGATLDVSSRPGEGTTVSVTLPLPVPADRPVEITK